tara:strand:- start:22 stop:378 length:357 start_codon:yes stop_codon:yes gene_type:complete
MSHLDKKVFGKKTYSNLLKEIYDNQKKKEGQIAALISELKPLIQDIGDATMIVPLIKEYMELGIKNDEALIKVATIFQRIFANDGNEDNGFGISEEEKDQLLKDIKSLQLPPKKDNEE